MTQWWRDAVIYQIYPRSFADGDGDGMGDLAGITARMGYLAELGIDALWLSPCFASPQVDHGYDISDYRDIDDLFGSLADMDELIATAHDYGIKVTLDFVPNHTSDQHAWFQAARGRRARIPGARPLPVPRRPRTGRRRAAQQLEVGLRRPVVDPGRRSPTARRGSGTTTCSPPSSRTSTGATPRWSRSSSASCGSGWTGAPTDSGSTSPTR